MEPRQIRVFLSYQSTDKEFVEALAINLRLNGVDVFFDKWDISAGDSIPEKLEEALSGSDIFVYILSLAAITSKWVSEEYYAFLYRKVNEHSLRIIPIMRRLCKPPPFVAPLHYIDFREFDYTQGANFNPEKIGPFRELLDAIFKVKRNPPLGPIHPAFASYELYFQRMKVNPSNPNGTENYEVGFKNITSEPLLNFVFTIRFTEPVISIEYDFKRSSANMMGVEAYQRIKLCLTG